LRIVQAKAGANKITEISQQHFGYFRSHSAP
jgi:hypothetical protein